MHFYFVTSLNIYLLFFPLASTKEWQPSATLATIDTPTVPNTKNPAVIPIPIANFFIISIPLLLGLAPIRTSFRATFTHSLFTRLPADAE